MKSTGATMVLIGCLAAGLSGCATLANTQVPRIVNTNAYPLKQFVLDARISVRRGEQLDTARINWRRAAGRDVVRVFAPFGAQVAELVVDDHGATLTQGRSEERDTDVASLSQTIFGVSITLEQLLAWLQGEATNLTGAQEWHLELGSMVSFGPISLAKRIVATRGDQVVRLVLDDFSVDAPAAGR